MTTPRYRVLERPFRSIRRSENNIEVWFYLATDPDWAHYYPEDPELTAEMLQAFWWADALEFA